MITSAGDERANFSAIVYCNDVVCLRYRNTFENKMVKNMVYGKKPFKNLLLQNRQADFHETWYVASGTPAHHSLFK